MIRAGISRLQIIQPFGLSISKQGVGLLALSIPKPPPEKPNHSKSGGLGQKIEWRRGTGTVSRFALQILKEQ